MIIDIIARLINFGLEPVLIFNLCCRCGGFDSHDINEALRLFFDQMIGDYKNEGKLEYWLGYYAKTF